MVTSEPPTARVLGVFTGLPQPFTWLGRELTSSIFKERVDGPVRVRADHLEGDRQADPSAHGGADKAVSVYTEEDAAWWATELGRPPETPQFGENLRVSGIDVHAAVIGERWRIGTAVLQVSEPRTPCWKIGLRMGDPRFPRAFAAARRPGVMLRVLEQGVLQAGDTIDVLDRPAHGVTVRQIGEIYYGRSRDLEPMRRAVELAAHWRAWVEHRTVWHLEDERTKVIPFEEAEARRRNGRPVGDPPTAITP